MSTNSDGDGGRAEQLGALLRDGNDEPSRDWKARGEEELIDAFRLHGEVPSTRTTKRVRRRLALSSTISSVQRMGVLAVAAIALVALFVWFKSPGLLHHGSSVTFQIANQDGSRREGRVVSTDAVTVIDFSEGSRFEVQPKSSVRVRETDGRGATLVVERGRVDSSVVSRERTRFSVLAGPYEVRVVGTRFVTQWDPDRGEVSVDLTEGEVKILGAGIARDVTLQEGQSFVGHQGGKWRVRPLVVEGPGQSSSSDRSVPLGRVDREVPDRDLPAATRSDSDSESHVALAAPAPPSNPRGIAPPVPDKTVPTPRNGRPTRPSEAPDRAATEASGSSWGSLVSQGEFERVIERVEERGVERCLSSCGAEQLRALADAARYTARIDLAQRALLRLRQVSPDRAPRAGYLLGSLAEATGRFSDALPWYRTYLAESPQGALVAEARAAELRCLRAMGRKKEATRAARSYLKSHPNGVGTKVARQILKDP